MNTEPLRCRMKNKEQRTQNSCAVDTPSIIGLTGGIGSGKSFVAVGLRAKGYAVYDCDREAKRIIETNLAVRSQIESLFGSEVYTENRYNSQVVAEQVFREPELLQALNAVVHPAVRFDVAHWARKQEAEVVFVESAILFESGFDSLCKAVVCVSAPEEVRIERAMKRDGATREQVERRILNQMSEAERNARASLIIQNTQEADCEKLVTQIEQFLRTIF